MVGYGISGANQGRNRSLQCHAERRGVSALGAISTYVASLDEDDASKEAATRAIAATGLVLGLETQLEFEGNDEIGELLEKINDHYKGFIFMFDSLVLHGNEVLVGPLKAAAT